MFRVSDFRRADPDTLGPAELVLVQRRGKLIPAMVVDNPYRPGSKGLLVFPPGAQEQPNPMPLFAEPRVEVLALGQRAEFVWSGKLDELNPDTNADVSVGHLLVARNKVAISGLIRNSIREAYQYWDIATGKDANDAVGPGIYITAWTVGFRDIGDEFSALASFPVIMQTD